MKQYSIKNMEVLRAKISEIDSEILALLIQRFELTDNIGVIKVNNNIPIENKIVENQILERLINKTKTRIDSESIGKIYAEIFAESKRRQKGI